MTDPSDPSAAPPGAPHPHTGPPPGYGPPPGQAPHPGQAAPPGQAPTPGYPVASAPTPSSSTKAPVGALLSLVSVVCMALAVSLKEDGANGWERVGVWAGFAIAAAVLTLAPVVRENLNLASSTAWQVGVAGAAGLVVYWILIVLPWIEQNVAFLATVGVGAGVWAAWRAPGRPGSPETVPQTW